MFCPNCGKELRDGARFCTACGSPLTPVPSEEPTNAAQEPVYEEPVRQPEEPAYKPANEQPYEQDNYDQQYDGYEDYYEDTPAPKKNLKPLIITLAIIAAAAVVGLVLYFTLFRGSGGGDDLETAQTRTFDAFADRTQATAFLKNADSLEKFGVNVKIDNLGSILSLYNSYMSMLDIEAELDVAADKDGNASATLFADGMGMTANAGVYKTAEGDTDIVVDIPKFLDDTYGISLATLADDLDDSIFSPDADTYYSIPDYMYDMYQSSFETIASGAGSITPEIVEELKNELQTNEDSRIELEKTKEKVSIQGEEVSCTVYKGTIDTDKIISILEVTADWVDDKDELAGLVNLLAVNMMGTSGGNMSASKMVKQITSQIEDYDVDLDLEYDVCKGYLARAYLSGKVDGQKIKVEMIFGADPAKTEEMSFKVKVADVDFSATVDLSKADKNQISAVVESEYEDIYFEFEFKYDDKNKEFELSAENAYRSFLIEGGMDASEDTVIITDPTFYENGDELLTLEGITVTLTKNPKIKTLKGDFPDGYTNILSLDEDEFDELSEKINDIMYSFG